MILSTAGLHNCNQTVSVIQSGHSRIAMTVVCQKQTAFLQVTLAMLPHETRILRGQQVEAFLYFVNAVPIIGKMECDLRFLQIVFRRYTKS